MKNWQTTEMEVKVILIKTYLFALFFSIVCTYLPSGVAEQGLMCYWLNKNTKVTFKIP